MSIPVRPDLTFQVIFLKAGEYLGAPTVLGEFSKEVRIEMPGEMRAVVMADPPDETGRSFTSAKLLICDGGEWKLEKKMTMRAMLTATPSFEFSVEGTPYRFVVMPRMIVPAASQCET